MDKIINTITQRHTDLFGENAASEKIDIGFTNIIYTVNNRFVIKICNRENKEAGFLKEIDFYKRNAGASFLPTFYYSDCSKTAVPYCYEIIQKVEGVTLYSVWHTLKDCQRKEIIGKLCEILKTIHSHNGQEYDWVKYNKDMFLPLLGKVRENRLFTQTEIQLLENAFCLFDKYLPSDQLVTVHNDLHFDNVIYDNGNIKLIDFERSIIAPPDFELDILYRMVRKPWKFASGDTEQYTHPNQYSCIMDYVAEFYPQLMHTPFLYHRLAIYDMIYFLKQYVNAPQYPDLRCDVVNAAKAVVSDPGYL